MQSKTAQEGYPSSLAPGSMHVVAKSPNWSEYARQWKIGSWPARKNHWSKTKNEKTKPACCPTDKSVCLGRLWNGCAEIIVTAGQRNPALKKLCLMWVLDQHEDQHPHQEQASAVLQVEKIPCEGDFWLLLLLSGCWMGASGFAAVFSSST